MIIVKFGIAKSPLSQGLFCLGIYFSVPKEA